MLSILCRYLQWVVNELRVNRVFVQLQASSFRGTYLEPCSSKALLSFINTVLHFLLNLVGRRHGQTLRDSFVSGSRNDVTK